MALEAAVHSIMDSVVVVAKTVHFPIMISALVFGIFFRLMIYYTVRRHDWFGREFEKRVGRFLQAEAPQKSENISFFLISKRLLEKTFFEVFENREKLKRRKPDQVMLASDRFFLIKMGCAWLVHDVLKQIRFLRYGSQPPKLINITKNTFSKNPCFNRVFGIVPIGSTNDLLSILPGLFVIGGIFGTFLGVMKGLPELSGMDLNDPEKTKAIMDQFLIDIALSMGASLMGILFSVIMTLVNSVFNPDRVFVDIVDRFENSLDLLWNYSNSNEVPVGAYRFDENKDPFEALAEASLNQELSRRQFSRDMDSENINPENPTTKKSKVA